MVTLRNHRSATRKSKQQPHNINYGLVGYPVLMAADIVLYKANFVPVGIDQAPHLEFTRETVRSFNYRYNTDVLIEPDMKNTIIPKVLGIDGKEKMSKSSTTTSSWLPPKKQKGSWKWSPTSGCAGRSR
jgi:tryptophanyl-tRNA synthetase